MKIMLRAALAALSIASITPAFAGDGGDLAPNTFFTRLPGVTVTAQAQVQNAPAVTTAQNGQQVYAYVANSRSGTWLFPPDQNQGANS